MFLHSTLKKHSSLIMTFKSKYKLLMVVANYFSVFHYCTTECNELETKACFKYVQLNTPLCKITIITQLVYFSSTYEIQ